LEENVTPDDAILAWPGTEDLVLSPQTVAADSLQERLEAAAAAGFTRIGLRPADYEAATVDDARLLQTMEGLGLTLVELTALGGWGESGEAGRRSRLDEERFYRMATALGGEYMVVYGDLDGTPEMAVERYGALCDRAAPYGITVALEFAPFTDVGDAEVAGSIVAAAGRPNAGVLVDTWHHFRGAADARMLRSLPPASIVAVHIDDGPEQPVGEMWEETTTARLLPGEGSFGVAPTLATLAAHGVCAPIAVEVLSDHLRTLTAAESSALAFGSSVEVVAEAGRLSADTDQQEPGGDR
jgi:sugar phosphate isomerase/epimerase